MRLLLDSDVLVHALRVPKREVMIGGMDVFVLTYAELKEAVLITNDWALWYVAWKRGIRSYWLQGLRNEHVLKIVNGEEVVYPER